MNRWLLIALTASLGLAACSKNEETAAPAASAPQAAAPEPQAAPQEPAQGAPAAQANQGTVMHAEQAGGYTYAQVDLGNGKAVWIAGAPIEVKAGDKVQWGEYAVMHNFNAKSLGRTFDEILFVNAWGPVGAGMAQVAPHGAMPGDHPPMEPSAMQGAGDSAGEVKTVANAGGYSYLEIAQGEGTVWLAVPETTVQAGDKVSWNGGMTMRNFEAKSLGRTFPEIIFADAIRVTK